MTQEERVLLQEKIQDELKTLDKNIAALQKYCEPIPPQCALGDLARFELMHEQEVSEKALLQAHNKVNKLKLSLSKINEKDFGICQECEEEIGFARMSLLPESQLCIKCASSNAAT